MKYLNHVFLILAGVAMFFTKIISHVYLGGLESERYHGQEIINGVAENGLVAWNYSFMPYIIGLLLIASGVLGVVKEAKHEKS